MQEFIGLILKSLNNKETKEKFILNYLKINWAKIVGAVAADHTQPSRLEEHILIINTDNAAWSNNLLMLQKQILSKISQSLPVEVGKKRPYNVKGLKFFHGKIQELAKSKVKEEPFIPKLSSTKKCPSCGVKLIEGEEICSNCLRRQKTEERSKIHKILCQAPWYDYRDCVKYLKCDKINFMGVKGEMQELAKEKALMENAKEQDIFFAVMLVLGKDPTQVDHEMIKRCLKTWKRSREYVSTPRKQLSSKK